MLIQAQNRSEMVAQTHAAHEVMLGLILQTYGIMV